MKRAYVYLAFAVPVLVLVQAATIAWGVFDVDHNIENGTTYNEDSLGKVAGIATHAGLGYSLVPLVALALFVVSFFVKDVVDARKRAGVVLGLVILQVLLGGFGQGLPILGALHGINAFLVAGAAASAGTIARKAPAAPVSA